MWKLMEQAYLINANGKKLPGYNMKTDIFFYLDPGQGFFSWGIL